MKKIIVICCMILCLTACGKQQNDQIEAHKTTMRRFETMINTADTKLAKELVADDAPFYTPASPQPLYGGEGYLSVVHWMRTGFSDVNWTLEEMAAEGNIVAVRWTLRGTHDGEFLGVPATGKKIAVSVMNFYYFNDEGKVVNDIAAEGMIGILRGIGMLEK
ncbi:MAG: ester cyclase [Rhodospirillales bacterium]|nr:ester cyclase [Rhodospirillales bacterium]